LFATASSREITPTDAATRLAGYASRVADSTKILSPLEVSGLLLQEKDRRCLILSFDLLFIGPLLQGLINARLARIGLNPAEVVLLASHTHFAPATDPTLPLIGSAKPSYVEAVADAAEQLATELLQRRPSAVRLEVRHGSLAHSINRRRRWPFPSVSRMDGVKFGRVVMAPNPEGPTNELATVALFRNLEDHSVLAFLWNYTCHPVAVQPTDAVSPDYPGRVRDELRSKYGNVPVVFAQGFCGDIRPRLTTIEQAGLIERLKHGARLAFSGPRFEPSPEGEWTRWSNSLAKHVTSIVERPAVLIDEPKSVSVAASSLPLGRIFSGTCPDKPLAIQIVRLGGSLEVVALSAEPSVGWCAILDRAVPPEPGLLRLYAGYLGAAFGYLPTTQQIPEGGYEVQGFQRLFGLYGNFKAHDIEADVARCLRICVSQLHELMLA